MNFSLTVNITHQIIRILFIFFLLPVFSVHATTDFSAVLVASKYSSISPLKTNDIRRIFLGLRPVNSTQLATPVINISDQHTYIQFLKNIMYLTERGYQRKLIKRVFRQGADNIQVINSHEKLAQWLRDNPDSFSYMLKQDAEKQPELKIIQVLW